MKLTMLVVKDPYVDSAVEEGGDLPFMEHTSKPFQEKIPIHKNRSIFLF